MKDERRRAKKQFKRQLRQCRKALKKAAKHYLPYDYCEVFKMMKIIFRHWTQYYGLGYNVWGDDSEENQTRKEIADELLSKLDAVEVNDDRETVATFADCFKNHILRMWD